MSRNQSETPSSFMWGRNMGCHPSRPLKFQRCLYLYQSMEQIILTSPRIVSFQMLTCLEATEENQMFSWNPTNLCRRPFKRRIVIKRPHILRRQDPGFAEVVSRVQWNIFLPTPHRGAKYATTSDRIFTTVLFVAFSKSTSQKVPCKIIPFSVR